MCGFAGFLGGLPYGDPGSEHELLRQMGKTIEHRGPDSEGIWLDASLRLGFSYRRLAILDLTEAGHQPMTSVSGRFVVVFNGEIYNHLELRRELESKGQAPQWRGHSDTETLVAGFEAWGIEETLRRTQGMFAIGVWDRMRRVLTLSRDRLGEKPLYYGWQGSGREAVFLFASELKALKPHPGFQGRLNHNALSLFLRHDAIPAPHSIFLGISKLPPAHLLEVSLEVREPKIWPYWSLLEAAHRGLSEPFSGSPEEGVEALETLLRQVVAQQMIADVPLGTFLSGGIDSSTITAIMQGLSNRPIKTFTIGFQEDSVNEALHAEKVARHLGTLHTALQISSQDALDTVPMLPALYDEPFADSSQIPTYLVARLAKQHVTVALSGDAGDELFCGYNRYLFAEQIWGKSSKIPAWLRKLISKSILGIRPSLWDSVGRTLLPFQPPTAFGDKMHKVAGVLDKATLEDMHFRLVSSWVNPDTLLMMGHEPATLHACRTLGLSGIERMMAVDALFYLPDDILVKLDRACMGVSLESRTPFLDHRVVELAWSLPLNHKLRQGVTKWPLRQILHKHVPPGLVERPKSGFSLPLGEWLRGPLQDWAESLLDPSLLASQGIFNPGPIKMTWQEHKRGYYNHASKLWNVLMFQAWNASQKGN